MNKFDEWLWRVTLVLGVLAAILVTAALLMYLFQHIDPTLGGWIE